MRPSAGDTICGRILIEDGAPPFAGAQAFGDPLCARARDDGTTFWLTVVERTLVPSQVDLSRFMAGANGLMEMDHPTLAKVVLVDREADFCVIGCETLPDVRSLADVLDAGEGKAIAARVAVELARGLAFLHAQGRIHGALTAGNVLSTGGAPLMTQHGICALCDAERFAAGARKLGGDVVAPEVKRGGPFTAKIDVYAWGALVAAMLTGLDGADAVMSLMDADVSGQPLFALAKAALDPEPQRRMADAGEVLHGLAAADRGDLDDDPWRAELAAIQELANRYVEELETQKPRRRPRTFKRAATEADPPELAPRSGEMIVSDDPVPDPFGMSSAKPPPNPDLKLHDDVVSRVRFHDPNAPSPTAATVPGFGDPPPPPRVGDHPPSIPPPPPPVAIPSSAVVTLPPAPNTGPPPPPESPPGPRRPGTPAELLGGAALVGPPEPVGPPPGPVAPPAAMHAPGPPVAPALQLQAAPPPMPLPGPALPMPSASGSAATLPAAPSHSGLSLDLGPNAGPGRVPVPDIAASPDAPEIKRVLRTPGERGPRPSLMAAVVFVAATALAGGLTAPVASHRGGLAPFLGLRSPDDAQTEQQVEAPPIHEAYADAAGAPPPGPAGACPDDMVRFEKEGDMLLCIDAGEFPGLREVPQVNVTLDDARDSCRAKGRRLCSTVEWERACTGPKGEKYPYGNDYGRGVCNEARADGAGRNLSRSGASDRCVSAEGAFDLVGNVGEWVEEGVVLGGDANARKPTCGTKQEARASSKSASTGFRCCLVVHTQPLP